MRGIPSAVAIEGLRTSESIATRQLAEHGAALAPDEGSVRISVRDDGRGLGPLDGNGDGARRGRGLHNMSQRAQAVGGTLEVVREARGCSVILALPVAPAVAPPTDSPSA